MKNFADLLCKDDPADEAPAILGRIMDLVSAAHHALLEADASTAKRIANETATLMEVILACAERVDAGVWDLQRAANRGRFRARQATGGEA